MTRVGLFLGWLAAMAIIPAIVRAQDKQGHPEARTGALVCTMG